MTAEYNETENSEKKSSETKSSEKKPKENNWMAFGIFLLITFAIVLLSGLLGANFVFFTRITDIDKMFPSNDKQPPYAEPSAGKMSGGRKMKGGNGASGCGESINFTESPLFKNKYFRGMFEYGAPYSSESSGDSFFSIIGDWVINKIKFSYIWLRMFIKNVIQITGSTCEFLPDSMKDIIPFILGPIVIGLLLVAASLWWLPTLVSTFLKDDSEWGMIISILGLFFGWTWTVPVILSIFQVLGVFGSFMFLPFMLNSKEIMEIMGIMGLSLIIQRCRNKGFVFRCYCRCFNPLGAGLLVV